MTCGTFYRVMFRQLGQSALGRIVTLCFEPWSLCSCILLRTCFFSTKVAMCLSCLFALSRSTVKIVKLTFSNVVYIYKFFFGQI